MYSKVQDEVFEGILTAALNEFIETEMNSMPSDEEIAKMYPAPKKLIKVYRRKAKEQKYHIPLPFLYLKRVAVVFLAIISISFGVLATSEEVRAAIVNTVVTWYDKFIQLDFTRSDETIEQNGESTEPIINVSDLVIGYIPSQYELASSTEESQFREYIYTTESGDYMLIGIYSSESTEVANDIEVMNYEQLTINGNEAYILYNESERMGSVIIGNRGYTIVISSISEKEDILKVAENIK